MLLHEFLAAHRAQILAACRGAVQGDGHGGNAAHVFDEMIRFVASRLSGATVSLDGVSGPGGETSLETTSETLVGGSAAMLRTRCNIDQLSRRSRTPVLLVGEFGTGKRHCARALHAATYPDGEWFELNGAEQMKELEGLLGSLHSPTSALSAVGLTVYVHELSERPMFVQLHLSKLLAEQRLPFRVIASSRRALAQAAREGLVRSDLAFRFPTHVELPPLRERLEDIPELARQFARLAAEQTGAAPISFGETALQRLAEHAWPGNLTELENLVQRLSLDFGPALIEASDLPPLDERVSGLEFHLPPTGIDFAALERELLSQALAMAGNNQTRAATLLGLTRDQLRYRLAKFEIPAASSG